MGTLQFKNNASTTLSGSINNSQTAITVVSGSSFPSLSAGDYFYATMYEVSSGTEINIEIVKVTATSGSNWTIVRAQDGTTARSRNGVDTCYIELRLTAASAALMLQKDNDLSDVASVSTARTNLGLGSIATQASSNVSVTGGAISGTTIAATDSTFTIVDNADSTKKAAFEVSGITTAVTRTFTFPNASGTLALISDLTSGYQPLDSDLTAVAGLSTNGLIARTGSGTAAVRTLTAPAAGITVSNGDGVSGNPTLALANDLSAVEGLTSTGFVRRTAADTWSAAAIADGDLPSALTGKTYNALTLTAAATGFTVAGGTTSKTLTVSNTLTLAGTDSSTLNIGAGGTLGTGAYATIANYAPLASPAFTGTPTAPTAAAATNTTQVATTAHVYAERANTATLTNKTITAVALSETKVAVSASAIDLATGNYFTKTISGTTTFTISNTPASGTAASFILDLTNGGSATVNWWTGMKWAGGTAPTLTSSGRDVLGFFTHDGGTTWTGLLLAKDAK